MLRVTVALGAMALACGAADVPFALHELGKTRNESVAVADFDGDGDLDLVTASKKGGPWLLENRRIGK